MLVIAIQNDRQNLQFEHASGAIEFGRGLQRGAIPRCTIDDAAVSRDMLHLEPLPGGRVRARNLSQRVLIELPDGSRVGVNETREMALPVRMTFGNTVLTLSHRIQVSPPSSHPTTILPPPPKATSAAIEAKTLTLDIPPHLLGGLKIDAQAISDEAFASEGFQSIAMPVKASSRLRPAAQAPVTLGESPSPEVLARWMETILALQRSDGSAEEFYHQAACALVNMIGLDVGLVILLEGSNWKVVARAARDDDDPNRMGGREFSQTVLAQVQKESRTFYQDLGELESQASLRSVDAVVASPIFRINDQIAGALYGMRRSRGRVKGAKITPLEAQLVQLLAAAVGAYMTRSEATRTRTQFEQFFSSELVKHLELDPRLLEGRETNVTVMFADVRAFSKHSERLGAAAAIRWMNDVLNELSACVRDEDGVLVDYVGDELMAMWGAPGQQPDQALRAVRAALAMHACLPRLNERWQSTLGEPMRIGVGINSGPAQVGNVGSTIKFKYGALGNTVNLASRVQGLTKYLRCGLLVTEATRMQLGEQFVARRVLKTRVVNIETPVSLYEIERSGAADRRVFFAMSQAALDALETGSFALAANSAGALLSAHANDGPLLLTLTRAAEALMRGGEGFDVVWTPPGK